MEYLMRLVAIALGLGLLVGCGPDFASVQNENTIEAYEKFQADNPDSIYQPQIDASLDELYFKKASDDATADSWTTYKTKFPKGKHVKEADAALEDLAYADASKANTVDAWKKYLTDFPKASKEHRTTAEGAVAVMDYGKIEIGEVKVEQVNLAEDPKGPKDGWGIQVDVKNAGDKTIEYLKLSTVWNGPDGSVLDSGSYALVTKNNPMPHPEIEEKPMAPGETRHFAYTSSKIGLDVTPTAVVTATNVKFAGGDATADAQPK